MPTHLRGAGTGPVCAAAAALLLSACSGPASAGPAGADADDGPVRVVTSTDVWGDVAAQVGGDAVQVTPMVEGQAQDPHEFEASARTQLALSKAQVVVRNGGGYDDFVTTMLDASGSSPAVLDAVELSGHRAGAGGELNEHVWYDLPTVARVADRLAQVLSEQRPDRAAQFARGAAAFTGRLAELEATEAGVRDAVTASGAGTGVAVTEPVPLYLLQACGLHDLTPPAFSDSVEEGVDASPAALRATEDLLTGHQVRALVYNAQTAGPQTALVVAAARAEGVPVVAVTETLPAGRDYVSWMSATLSRVRTAVAA